MSQTLKVPANSLKRVKGAMEKHGISSQKALAEVMGISLYKVREFMAGRPIDANTFIQICERLELDWQKLTRISPGKADEIMGKEVVTSSPSVSVSPPTAKRSGIPRLASHLFRSNLAEPEPTITETATKLVEEPIATPKPTTTETATKLEEEPIATPEPTTTETATKLVEEPIATPEPTTTETATKLVEEPIVTPEPSTDEMIVTEEGNLPVIDTVVPHKEPPIDWQELLTAINTLIENEQWDEAAQLLQQFDLSQTQLYGEVLELLEKLLPPHWRQGGRRVSDPILHGWVLCNTGTLSHNLGLSAKALSYLEIALKITRQYPDRGLEMQCFKSLATLHQSLGNYQAAISFYQQYFDLAETEDLYQEQAYILHQLGNIYFSLHQYRTAIGYYNQFLNHKGRELLTMETLKTLRNIGTCYINLKHYENAIAHLEKLAELTVNDPAQQAYTALQLGLAYAGMGLHHTALEYLEQSRSIASPLDNPYLEMQAARGLTLSYIAQRNYPQAERWGREWLTLARIVANRDEQIQAMYYLRLLSRSIA